MDCNLRAGIPDLGRPLEVGKDPADEVLITAASAGRVARTSTTLRLGACSTAIYFFAYFLRYPIYMLPDEIASRPFASVGSANITFQEALSIAFGLGFGLAKFPALRVMSSTLFFRHRWRFLVTLHALAYILLSVPTATSRCNPALTVLGQFLSCFPQSWIYGGLVTYLEGRQHTETLLALLIFSSIFAGSASRGTAAAVINFGVPPHLMPLVVGGTAIPLITVLLWLLDCCPPPSPADTAARRPRAAMTSGDRRRFLCSYWPGLVLLVSAYCMLMAVRSARDLFNRDLITAANGGKTPSSFTFAFLDVPAAGVAACVQGAFVHIKENRTALLAMVVCMVGFLAATTAVTVAFQAGCVNGIVWQVLFGIGASSAACFLTGSPVYERLVACSTLQATSTLLLYISDLSGYVVIVALVIWKALLPGDQVPGLLLQRFLMLLHPLLAAAAVCLASAGAYFAWKLRGSVSVRPPRDAGLWELH